MSHTMTIEALPYNNLGQKATKTYTCVTCGDEITVTVTLLWHDDNEQGAQGFTKSNLRDLIAHLNTHTGTHSYLEGI